MRLKLLRMFFIFCTGFAFLIVNLKGCSQNNSKKRATEEETSANSSQQPSTDLLSLDNKELCAPPESEKSRVVSSNFSKTEDKKYNQSVSFESIQKTIVQKCGSCHLAPGANTGGFAFVASEQNQKLFFQGQEKEFLGFLATAESMSRRMLDGTMPPSLGGAQKSPEELDFLKKTALELKQWKDATQELGNPQNLNDVGSKSENNFAASSELGDCIPAPQVAGSNVLVDRKFDAMDALPKFLSETDYYTESALELAKTGTFAYTVEYPLWADNAEKGRWVHVPTNSAGEKQSIKFEKNFKTGKIEPIFPNNTRFYKTFFKKYTLENGNEIFKKVETRIYVIRSNDQPLFGAYLWNEEETEAELVRTPYRDGTPWKDVSLNVDVGSGKRRLYALPGRDRCTECHMGGTNSVLGFSPLQLNRRKAGEGGNGREFVGKYDLLQLERLQAYGVLSLKSPSNENLAEEISGLKLETSKLNTEPRNIHELNVQAYMVGNCAHCHNEQGFAISKNNVKFNTEAGELFQYNTINKSIHFSNSQKKLIVSGAGDLDRSYLWEKVTKSKKELGLFGPMPMHTPGKDCKLQKLVGRWILSFKNAELASSFEPDCEENAGFEWQETDFTWPVSEIYVPRRADWKDEKVGMSAFYRNLEISIGLQTQLEKKFPVGFWDAKPECTFPPKNAPDVIRPWMLNEESKPKQPWSEIYETTAGAWYYRTSCSQCHGSKGDGTSALASNLLNWSGGEVRVANFVSGMFGRSGKNLETFDIEGTSTENDKGMRKNLGANYLVWMAMEGTNVNFPQEASAFLKGHKAQMLKQISDKCSRHLPGAQFNASENHEDFDVFREICFFENEGKQINGEWDIGYNQEGLPISSEAQNKWLQKAAINAGFAIYDYLKTDLSFGKEMPSRNQCEAVSNSLHTGNSARASSFTLGAIVSGLSSK